MFGLRNRFERFCLKHRTKGIPNLMLYVVLGSAVVYIMSLFSQNDMLYELLRFDKAKIMQGQVWRLISYVFAYAPGQNPFMILISFYFFYYLSKAVESIMGTFRFNLYYFSGVILMDAFAMILCPTEITVVSGIPVPPEYFTYSVYSNMAYFMHLSIVLTYCVVNPDAQFLVFFFLPVKAWFLALVDILFLAWSIYNMSTPLNLFPHSLFPLVGVANFLLFAGVDVLNLLPAAIRPNTNKFHRAARRKKTGQAIPFTPADRTPKADKKPRDLFVHRCTVCGKTDTSHPDLEFRYCSRCNGYFCYCQEHISNHTHVE